MACSCMPLLGLFQLNIQACRQLLKLISPKLVTIKLRLKQAQVTVMVQLIIRKWHAWSVYDAMKFLHSSTSWLLLGS